jgi:hypothetical protein
MLHCYVFIKSTYKKYNYIRRWLLTLVLGEEQRRKDVRAGQRHRVPTHRVGSLVAQPVGVGVEWQW